jgi:predicted metal-dependent hydrolase
MSELAVRKLLVDLTTPFEKRWFGGDAFKSAFFNALSMSFPVGEQFFIDSVREGAKQMDDTLRAQFAAEVQGFIGQEATHRRIHALFNGHLEKQGFVNKIAVRSANRIKANAHQNVRHQLAATAATEHFTDIFADWLLSHSEIFEGTEPRLKTMWQWHAAEEAEHRCTAFDVYKALGGNEERRIRIFHYVTFTFLTDVMQQTINNLWHDGSLFKLSTWKSGYQLLLSKDGLLRSNVLHWRAYKAADFHPMNQSDVLSKEWLEKNTSAYSLVGKAASV